MTKVVVIASAKGGVGKTTTAINLGTALNLAGRDVTVIDGNLSTPNVSLYLGAPKVPITIHDVLKGKGHIHDAVYMHSHGLKIVPGDIAHDAMDGVEHEKLSDIVLGLIGTTEIVIIDSAAGISREALAALRAGDELIIVTTPDLASVTDALKTVREARKMRKKILGVVLTRVNEDNLDMASSDIETILEVPIIGTIPEDDTVRLAGKNKHPVTFSHPNAPSSIGYKKLASLLLGEKYVEKIETKPTFFDYLLTRLGLK